MTDVIEQEALDIERDEDGGGDSGKGRGRGGKAKAKKDDGREIKVVSLEPATVRLRIAGTTALVVHQFSEKGKMEMRDVQQKGAKRKRDPKVPANEWDGARYKLEIQDDEGNGLVVDGFPSMTVKKSLIAACRMMDGVAMTTVRQTVFINRGQFLIPIERDRAGSYYHGDENSEFAPVMREDIVRVGGRAGPGSGTADLRYRPEYDPWSLALEVEFLPNLISHEQLFNLFRFAGFGCGIGENRPEKTGGDWGCFRVADVEEIKTTSSSFGNGAKNGGRR